MNKVILMGRLTRDPMISYSQSNTQMAIARWTLAVDRRMKRDSATDQQTADFISCIAFGKQAEFVERYLHQGTKIAVEGRIQTGSYTNKDGQRVYTTDIVVENVEFAESKQAQGGQSNQGGSRPNPNNASMDIDGFLNIPDGIDDEGLPFN